MKYGLLLTVCLLVLLFVLGAAADFDIPPPPEGWQSEVTPGFEPSIEKIIIDSYLCNVFHTSFTVTLRNWGREAVPVIIKLHEDGKWAEYRRVTASMLAQSDYPEARQYFLGRFRSLVELDLPSQQEADEMASLCVNLVDSGDPEWIQMLIAGARSGNVAYAPQYAEALLRLGTGDALDAMRVLRARLPGSSRDAVNWCIADLEGRMRAQEPMPTQREADTGKRRRRAPELRKHILAFKGRPSVTEERKLKTAVKALVDAEGGKAVRLLAKVARDPDFPASVRMEAVVGLGLVGTEESAKAYAKLRETALDMPWAPTPREEYTHAQKMAEAAAMTISVIPYMDARDDHPNKCLEAMPWGTRVSDDYRTGRLRYGPYDVATARVASEWLVVGVYLIPVP